jgi:hypothetical protein
MGSVTMGASTRQAGKLSDYGIYLGRGYSGSRFTVEKQFNR